MAEDPNTKEKIKIKVIPELHELTKTYVILYRDAAFLTSLTKFYQSDILNIDENIETNSENLEEKDKEMILLY